MSTQATSEVDVKQKLEEWSAKLGTPYQELEDKYNVIFDTLEGVAPNQRSSMTLKKLRSELTSQLRSPALSYEGVIVGVSSKRDLVQKMRETCFQKFDEDQTEALRLKYVKLDEEGRPVPLDYRPSYEKSGKENKRYGKPLPEHSWSRTVVVAVRPANTKEEWKPAILKLSDDLAQVIPPVTDLVSFRANGDWQEEQNRFMLRGSKTTKFDVVRELDESEFFQIVEQAFQQHTVPLGKCMEYHEKTKNDYDRIVVTEACVDFVNYSDTEGNNHQVFLSDESLPIEEGYDSVTMWFPDDIRSELEMFGKNSICLVIAQTSLGKFYDRQEKQSTDEDVIQLNGLGIFAKPGGGTPPE